MSKALELAKFLDVNARSKQDYEAADELRRLSAVEAAAKNLVKVKGRYHTEQAYKALQNALGETK